MPSIFFQIGTTDVTADTDIQTAELNSIDEFELWVDGNHREHREFTRTRITGTIRVGFDSEAKHAAFVALLQAAKTSGLWATVTAYVINLDSTETFEAFLDPVGKANWDIVNGRRWVVLTLSVRER